MIHSLVMLGFFAAGVLAAYFGVLPDVVTGPSCATYVFYVLLGLVAIGVGSNEKCMVVLKEAGWRIVLIPAGVLVGSLLGSAAASLAVDVSLREALAVGAGFGYYSLSSIIIAPIAGQSLAVVALLSNLAREIITLIAAPLLARYIGKYAPIAAGGATTMDSTLAVVARLSGGQYTMVAVFSGVVLTFLVPLLIPLILKIGL